MLHFFLSIWTEISMAEKSCKQLELWSRLDGKVVMVTGASSGLGLEFCLDLAKAGCRIIAAARRTDRLKSLCEEINQIDFTTLSSGVRAVGIELDISGKGSVVEASVEEAWNAFGWIDVLVNNAGVRGTVASSLELSADEWNNTLTTNLTGSWLVSKCVCQRMRASNRKGSIINITSIDAIHRGLLPGAVAYAGSKSGVDMITKVMALELGKYQIRVNSIAAGLFKSEITGPLMEKKWLKNVAMRSVPLRKFGTTNPDLTSVIRYLIHDSSKYVSGNIFIVDGGTTLPGVPIFSSL